MLETSECSRVSKRFKVESVKKPLPYLCKALIRPKIEYGVEVYFNFADSSVQLVWKKYKMIV